MEHQVRSPRITHLSWGRLEIEGGDVFKDAKLFPGGAVEWDWNETDTHHVPGIQPADVQVLLEQGATVVVLSKGVYERLGVCAQTLAMLKDQGVAAHVLQTERAVQLYNDLREIEPVGGLFHSMC
ncbi:MAG: Mth938-like domain-containing protein [Planctomycetes bacterium]|nr:Mth938-like domain-containing protein [Planctomycetota bacterium]